MSELEDRALNDPGRLSALERTALLDSPVEEAFDRVTRLAMRVFRVPVSLISLVDGRRQFFKSAFGLPEPWLTRRETPLTYSFCKHVVASGKPLIVENAVDHPVFAMNPAVKDLGIVAYAGHPLRTDDGHVLGTLCAIDSKPRHWTDEDRLLLADLAAFVTAEIRLRERLTRPGAPIAPLEATPPVPPATSEDDVTQHLIKTITERIKQNPKVAASSQMLDCPRCRTTRRVEQLVAGPETIWLRCTICGHAWERDPDLA
jgi:GAF domain-containing protein